MKSKEKLTELFYMLKGENLEKLLRYARKADLDVDALIWAIRLGNVEFYMLEK